MLYEGFTSLDIVGPYEMLAGLPGAQGIFVAKEPGLITADTGISSIHATAGMTEVTTPDIVVVPEQPLTGRRWKSLKASAS